MKPGQPTSFHPPPKKMSKTRRKEKAANEKVCGRYSFLHPTYQESEQSNEKRKGGQCNVTLLIPTFIPLSFLSESIVNKKKKKHEGCCHAHHPAGLRRHRRLG
jgi:hypothetical protein